MVKYGARQTIYDGQERIRTTIYLTPVDHKLLKLKSVEMGMSMGDLIMRAIDTYTHALNRKIGPDGKDY